MGALIGAAITGAIAIYGMYQNSQAADEAKKEAQAAAQAIKDAYDSLQTDIEGHYSRTPEEQAAHDQAIQNYREGLSDADYEKYVQNFYDQLENGGRFEYGKDVDDFYNPHREEIVNDLASTVMDSAAANGTGRSWWGAKNLANQVADKNEQLYNNALLAYNTDRSQSFNEWNSYLQQKQNELTNLLAGKTNDLSAKKDLAQMYMDEDANYWNDLMNARIAAAQAGYNADWNAANAGNPSYDVGGMAQMIGAGANVGDKVGDYFSGSGSDKTA